MIPDSPPEFGRDGSPPPVDSQCAVIADWEVNFPVRARYLQRWQRQDPTIQLPPGASEASTISLTIGMATERANEIAASLGVKGLHGLSAALSSKVTTRISLSSEKTISKTVTLTNASRDKYRRYAIWHIVHTILLYAPPLDFRKPILNLADLMLAPSTILREPNQLSTYGFGARELITLFQNIEFIASDATNITFAKIARRR